MHLHHGSIKQKNNAAAAYSTRSQSGKPSMSADTLFRLDELTASSMDLQTKRPVKHMNIAISVLRSLHFPQQSSSSSQAGCTMHIWLTIRGVAFGLLLGRCCL